jgi:hypothetical protein
MPGSSPGMTGVPYAVPRLAATAEAVTPAKAGAEEHQPLEYGSRPSPG